MTERFRLFLELLSRSIFLRNTKLRMREIQSLDELIELTGSGDISIG